MFAISLLIIIATIIGVSIGRYPFLRMNRATIAFVGAVLLIITSALSIDAAYRAIDLNTISLLLAIMILNANFRLSGFFYLISKTIIKKARRPKMLLAVVIVVSGFLSAIFLNDTIVIVFTPLLLEITTLLRRNPIPYLIALATSANVGSVATIIGNPQNIFIGAFSAIPFIKFSVYLLPVAIGGMVVIWLTLVWLYPKEFNRTDFQPAVLPKTRIFKPLLKKSIFSATIMLGALLAGYPTALAALGAAALLLITRRLKPERIFAEIDWTLLVFFASLFVVTGAVEAQGYSQFFMRYLTNITGNPVVDLSIVSVIFSNLISNVPAVLLLRMTINSFTNPEIAWLVMAMATTFAGNLTLIGSVANLIVAESARQRGVILSFKEYFRAGLPITIITLLLGILWLGQFY